MTNIQFIFLLGNSLTNKSISCHSLSRPDKILALIVNSFLQDSFFVNKIIHRYQLDFLRYRFLRKLIQKILILYF